MRGVVLGKKLVGLQLKNFDLVLFGRWGGCFVENFFFGFVWKIRKNKQKVFGNGDGGSISEVFQFFWKKRVWVDFIVESEEVFKSRMEVKVKIFEELKLWLVEDWDLVMRQKQLFQFFVKKNVDVIFEEYVNCKKLQGNVDNKEYVVNEVVGGIKEYFNVMLGIQLLYKFERFQYVEILLVYFDVLMLQIYGVLYFLRLFVRIGVMLVYMFFDEKSLVLLLGYLYDFFKYLVKNFVFLFIVSDYKVVFVDYYCKVL